MADFTFAHREEGFDEHINWSIRGYQNLLNEEGEVITTEFEKDPIGTYFGIDVYEVDGQLMSEKEYAKTL